MNHMINILCPLTKFGGGLQSFHEADDDDESTALAK